MLLMVDKMMARRKQGIFLILRCVMMVLISMLKRMMLMRLFKCWNFAQTL
jgi:hypothetical protein